MSKSSWLQIKGNPVPALESQIEEIVAYKISIGAFSQRDVNYLSKLSRPVLSDKILVTGERLEKLRTMCQAWDIDFRPVQITSHRKFVGKLIVAIKKGIQPVIRALLKDTIAQQRNFNASVIIAVTDLANEVEKLKTSLPPQ